MKRFFILCFIIMFFICGCSKDEPTRDNVKEKVKEKKLVQPISNYSCDYMDELDLDNKCVHKITSVATLTWECPAGYNVVGSYCWKSGGVLNLSKCGANHVEANGYCYSNFLATTKYNCYSGVLEGVSCVSYSYYEPKVVYSCTDGYQLNSDDMCEEKE